MPSNFEQLVFEIIATDRNASAAFDRFRAKVDQTSRSVDGSSGKLDRNARLLDELGKSADNNALKTSKWRSLVDEASMSLKDMGGALSGNVSGMGLMAAAGVALAPIAVTVGTGLGGLAIAAAGIVTPVLKAAESSGGLQANLAKLDPVQRQAARSLLTLQADYHAFQNELKPVVLQDMNAAIAAARPLLHGLEPVAAASGKALAQVFAQVGTEFRSGEWQQFFAWMAANAGPDIKLLGQVLTGVLNVLPGLLEGLQPLGKGLLISADGLVKFADALQKAHILLPVLGATIGFIAGGPLGALAGATAGGTLALAELGKKAAEVKPVFAHAGDSVVKVSAAVSRFGTSAGHILPEAGKGLAKVGAAAAGTAGNTAKLNAQLATLIGSMDTLAGNSVSALQAFHTLAKEAHAAGATFTGVNSNSLTLQGTLASQLLPSMESVIGQMKKAGAPTRDLAHYVGTLLAPAVKDGALKNDLMRTAIFSMAREAGYAGPNKIGPLTRFIDAYRTSLGKIPKFVATTITAHAQGSGKITFNQNTQSGRLSGGLVFMAAGGKVPGTGTRDSVAAMLTPGEAVVPRHLVPSLAPFLRANRVPGFAAGGFVAAERDVARVAPFMAGAEGGFMRAQLGAFMAAVIGAARAAAAALPAISGGGGPAAALFRRMYPAWSHGALWNAVDYVAMRESGWNTFAVNPSSGAAGVAQRIQGWAPFYQPGNAFQQDKWFHDYMASRYGGPIGAAAHERAFGWYDQGGWLPPGLSLAYNGTGRPERVIPSGGAPTFVIHNHVAPGANLAEVGRVTVEAIRQYERRSGSGWRK